VSPSITGGQSVRALGGRIGIRGFNDLDRNAGGERSVGIYVDGVYSGRKDALTEPTVGIERIEVLRGPQGTLFGRNSTAGVVSLTTRKPTDHPEVSLALNVGNYSTTDVEGWVGGPLAGDTLMGSLSVGYHDDDGYVDNVTLGNRQASYRTLSGRGLLRWSPSERLRVDLALDGLEDEGEGYNGEATKPPHVTLAPGPFTVAMNTGQLDTTDKYGAAVTVNYRLSNDLELMSLTATEMPASRQPPTRTRRRSTSRAHSPSNTATTSSPRNSIWLDDLVPGSTGLRAPTFSMRRTRTTESQRPVQRSRCPRCETREPQWMRRQMSNPTPRSST
jgi:iron complex outermembrane receptor protein